MNNIVCLHYAPQSEEDYEYPQVFKAQLERLFPQEKFHILPHEREGFPSVYIEYREGDVEHQEFCQNFIYDYDKGVAVRREGTLVWDEISLKAIAELKGGE